MDALIPDVSTNDPIISSVANVQDILIQNGAELTLATSALLVHGNIENYGGLISTLGTVTFTGGGDSFFRGNGTRFHRLALNKTQPNTSVTLETEIAIANETVFIQGILNGNGNEVIFLDGSDSRAALDASYINGAVRKIGNDEFTFPVGSNGYAAPIGISAPDSDTDQFVAAYFNEDPELAGYNTSEIEAGITNVSRCEYWILDREGGNASVFVSLGYENERSCGIVDPSQLAVMRWDGNQWDSHGLSSFSGDANSGIIKSNDEIQNFSPFTFGSGGFNNPLPIDLLYFDAEEQDGLVHLKWSTATETNNSYFMVERSDDGSTWTELVRMDGAGTSNSTLNYQAFDDAPLPGISYYRLSQTDFDGSREYFAPKSVVIESPLDLRVFPNPNNGQFEIFLNAEAGEVQIRLVNQSGIVVLQKTINQNRITMDRADLPAGLYLLEVTGITSREVRKVLIR
jgi:hypothetical protein